MISKTITRAFVFLSLVSSFLLQPAFSFAAQDVDITISAQIKGLSLEFPLSNLNGDLTDSKLLTTIKFGDQAPLYISEKQGLSAKTNESDEMIAAAPTSPPPVISPRDPVDPTASQSSVVIQEPTTKFILDILPSPTPTATPRPTLAPTKTPTPTPVTTAQPPTNAPLSNGGLNADVLFDMSNAYRASQGLPPFQKDARACELAVARAPEINAEVANGNMHAGMYGRNLPYWNTENIIAMAGEQAAFNWWINDGIHHAAIVGNYTYSCVACSGNSCAQEFTNFQPK